MKHCIASVLILHHAIENAIEKWVPNLVEHRRKIKFVHFLIQLIYILITSLDASNIAAARIFPKAIFASPARPRQTN